MTNSRKIEIIRKALEVAFRTELDNLERTEKLDVEIFIDELERVVVE